MECWFFIQILVLELSFIDFFLFSPPSPSPLKIVALLRKSLRKKNVIASSSYPCDLPIKWISLTSHPPPRLAQPLLCSKTGYTTKLEAAYRNVLRSKDFGRSCATDHPSWGVYLRKVQLIHARLIRTVNIIVWNHTGICLTSPVEKGTINSCTSNPRGQHHSWNHTEICPTSPVGSVVVNADPFHFSGTVSFIDWSHWGKYLLFQLEELPWIPSHSIFFRPPHYLIDQKDIGAELQPRVRAIIDGLCCLKGNFLKRIIWIMHSKSCR